MFLLNQLIDLRSFFLLSLAPLTFRDAILILLILKEKKNKNKPNTSIAAGTMETKKLDFFIITIFKTKLSNNFFFSRYTSLSVKHPSLIKLRDLSTNNIVFWKKFSTFTFRLFFVISLLNITGLYFTFHLYYQTVHWFHRIGGFRPVNSLWYTLINIHLHN